MNLAQSDLNLAELLKRRGNPAEAEKLFRHALDVRRRSLGPKHQAVGQSLQLIGLFYLEQGRLDESEKAVPEALALWRGIDPKHFEVGKCLNGLALIASRRGRYAEAEKTMERGRGALPRGPRREAHVHVADPRQPRGADPRCRAGSPRPRRSSARSSRSSRRSTARTAAKRSRRARAWARRCASEGRAAEALPLHRDSLAALLRIEGEKSAATAVERFQVGSDLIALGRAEDRDEARKLLDLAIGTMANQSPPQQRLADARAARAALD